MALVTWSIIPSSTYYAEGATYDDNTLYFLSDTGEIMKGAKPFNESVVMVDDSTAGSFTAALEAITTPARRRLYISTTTLEGKIYNGTGWVTAIKPVVDTVTADGVNPVTGKAVADYVATEIAKINGGNAFVTDVTYDADKKSLTVISGADSSELELSGLGVEIDYDKNTGALSLKDVKGAVLGSAVNLDLERFVSAAAYDETNKQIILAFTNVTGIAGGTYEYPGTMPENPTEGLACKAGDKWYKYDGSAWAELEDVPLTINVGDLVDTYTAEESETISLTVSGNAFKGAVKVSAEDGNTLQVKDDGLYVAPMSMAEYMKLVIGATAGDIATLDENGQVVDSGKAIGGETLADTPNANTLATEAAVAAIRTALAAQIATKIAKVENATAGNVPTLTAEGEISDSGKAIGGETLADTPNANTLATEAAVATAIAEATADTLTTSDVKNVLAVDDTDDTVPTSKAVVDALSWKTTL